MIIFNCSVCKQRIVNEDTHIISDKEGNDFCDDCGALIKVINCIPE